MNRVTHPGLTATLLLAALTTACAAGDTAETAREAWSVGGLTPVEAPVSGASGEPNLVAGPGGVFLSWIEPMAGGSHALRFARWDGGGWGPAGTVAEREDMFVNWADFPAFVALDEQTLAAHWLQKSGSGTYAYDVRMALSRDGGRSWSEDVIPHRDGIQAEHGFVSLLPLDAEVGVSWLDGRYTVDGEPMTLRFTTLSPDGTLGESVLLDSSVCDCCQTGLARTDAGPIVVYRNRTGDEVRDIAIVRRVDGEWTEPTLVHDDGWVIPGCPVNGPSIEAAGDRVAVAWFTGAPLDPEAAREDIRNAGEQGRVLAAFSDDGGATFSPPVRVDDGQAMGRVDLVLLDDGSAMVAWLERVEGSAEVRARYVDEEGTGPTTSITTTAAQRASGFPRMVRDGEALFFAWTEAGDTARVRTATARLERGDRVAQGELPEAGGGAGGGR